MSDHLRITRRRLPHWRLNSSVYFVTFRLAEGTLSIEERRLVLEHVLRGRGVHYELLGAVIMPDHAHLIIQPNPGVELSRILKGIKGVSARQLNAHRQTTGTIWQDESWDRIVRDVDELTRFADYIRYNPCKAGLIDDPEDYDSVYMNLEGL